MSKGTPNDKGRHTPGPWRLGRAMGMEHVVMDENDSPVCEMLSPYRGREDYRDANARLIAAAPDLLAALMYMLANAEADGWSDMMLADTRAAISKATGGAA